MDAATINIFFLLFATGLVFLMQAGFTCLEAGLTRPKNSINVAIKNLADFVAATLCFWMVGYGLMFGESHGGVVGTSKFFLPASTPYTEISVFLFQMVFCGTAATIVSGAIAERTRFVVYLGVSVAISVVLYPVMGHMIWHEDGILRSFGFVDFAGATAVHSVGGWVALAAIMVVGPRTGRFAEDGTVNELRPWSLPMSVLGCGILCFGWIGFNGGSTGELNGTVPLIVLNTMLAAAAGGLSAMAIAAKMEGLVRAEPLINGTLSGLVGITGCCAYVEPTSALMIGAISAAIMLAVSGLLLRRQLDDVVGAVPVHLACGIWGTIALALFSDPERLGTGLGMGEQLAVQVVGAAVCGLWSFGLAYIGLRLLNQFIGLRVKEEDEIRGLNMAEHGESTDMYEFLTLLEQQEATGDVSERVPEDPYSEVGQIATRYNRVLDMVEERDATIRAAKAQTDNILRSMTEGLVVVGSDLRIAPQYSKSAEELLGREDLAGQSFVDLLFPDLELTGEGELQRQMSTFLSTAFALFLPEQFHDVVENAPTAIHFPAEDGALRKFVLHYSPMMAEEELTGIVVTLSDATEVERLQGSIRNTFAIVSDAMDGIADIVSSPSDRAALADFLQEIMPLAEESANRIRTLNSREVGGLFRDVHTIKGGARLFRLAHLQYFAHQIEDTLTAVRTGEVAVRDLPKTSIQEDMAHLVEGLRAANTLVGPGEIGADSLPPPAQQWSAFLRRLKQDLLRSAAEDGKQLTLHVDADEAPRAREDLAILYRVLPHLAHNAVSHGVERPNIRREANKVAIARLHITLSQGMEKIRLVVQDDGRGVNIDQLRNFTTTPIPDDPTPETLFELLCTPGLSTASQVTATSGRGVGLDAVRDLMRVAGGEVRLVNRPGEGLTITLEWPRSRAGETGEMGGSNPGANPSTDGRQQRPSHTTRRLRRVRTTPLPQDAKSSSGKV